MAEVGSAFVSILPSARGFGSKLNSEVGGDIDSSGKTMGQRFGTAFKVGALALAAGGVFAAKFLSSAVGEAREAAVVTARTENVIKSMGLASKVSAGQVANLATAISNKTGVDDEAIQSGQNLLLTFKNVANDAGEANGVFAQTSRLMVDMSAAMGTDAKGAAIQLGKALNDPTKGLSALSRVGVSFSAQQAEQIKKFQESGQLAKAQGIILGELKNQFGGAAAAMATPADRLKVTWGNLKEQIGTALLPTVDRFLNFLLGAAPKVSAAVAGIGPAFGRIKAFLAPLAAQVMGFLGPLVAQVQAFFSGGGGGLLSGIQSFAQSIASNFLPVLQTMSNTFTSVVLPAVTGFVRYLASSLFPIFQQIAGIITGQVLPILASLARFFYGTIYPAVIKVVEAVASNLKPVFDQLVDTFRSSVLPTIEDLLAKFREWQPTIEKVITVVVKIIGKVLEFAAAILGKVLPPVIRFAGFLLRTVIPVVADLIGVVIKIIGKVVEFGTAVVNAVRTMIGWVKDKASAAWAFLKDKAVSAAEAILKPIQPIIDKLQNLVDYMRDKVAGIWDSVKSAGVGAFDAIRDAVQWVIDKVMALIKAIQSIPGIPGGPAGGNGSWKGPLPGAGVLSAPSAMSVGGTSDSAVLAELRALRAAVEQVAPGVTSGLNSVAATAQRSAR